MAKNELISLSLVANQPMHGYALRGVVQRTGLDDWGRVSPASIYNTLARLQKQGLVKVTKKKVGNMPERKVYAITVQGRRRLASEMKNAMFHLGAGDQPLNMAMTFGMGLKPRELIDCLKQRIRLLKEAETDVKQKYQHLKQFHIFNGMIMVEAAKKHVRVEIDTARQFIRMLEKEPEYFQRMSRQLKETDDEA